MVSRYCLPVVGPEYSTITRLPISAARESSLDFDLAVISKSTFRKPGIIRDNMSYPFAAAKRVYANCTWLTGASGSQPRVGLLLMDEISLIEIWLPRDFTPLTATCSGLQVCWLIFWYAAGLKRM